MMAIVLEILAVFALIGLCRLYVALQVHCWTTYGIEPAKTDRPKRSVVREARRPVIGSARSVHAR